MNRTCDHGRPWDVECSPCAQERAARNVARRYEVLPDLVLHGEEAVEFAARVAVAEGVTPKAVLDVRAEELDQIAAEMVKAGVSRAVVREVRFYATTRRGYRILMKMWVMEVSVEERMAILANLTDLLMDRLHETRQAIARVAKEAS